MLTFAHYLFITHTHTHTHTHTQRPTSSRYMYRHTIHTHTHTHTTYMHYIIFKIFIVLSHPLGTMPREIKQVIISRRITTRRWTEEWTCRAMVPTMFTNYNTWAGGRDVV